MEKAAASINNAELVKENNTLKTKLEKAKKAYDVSLKDTRKSAMDSAIDKYKSS